MQRLSLYTAPTAEPITIADVEVHSRLFTGLVAAQGQTDKVNRDIAAVRMKCEAITRRQLITAVWDLTLDGFPGSRRSIEIPLPPLQSITSITYIDPNGDTQTLDSDLYRVIQETGPMTSGQNPVMTYPPKCQPGIVLPVYDQVWPSTLDDIGVVTIRFSAGYGASGTFVPDPIKAWMLLNVANLWENRETETMASGRLSQVDLSTLADGLLNDFRIFRL